MCLILLMFNEMLRLVLFVFVYANLVKAELRSKYIGGCQPLSCTLNSLSNCEEQDKYWTQILYDGAIKCFCCRESGTARIVAGSNVVGGKGLFYGNAEKVCESLYVDEKTCRKRHYKDCNYQIILYKLSYVGCYYCRPRCTDVEDCEDMGRVCSSLKPYQPMQSCIFVNYRLGPGIGLELGADNSFEDLHRGNNYYYANDDHYLNDTLNSVDSK